MRHYPTKSIVIVILGQTATGKSDLAVKLSKKLGGEVISADSRQVYKGLDIGSGKITKREMKGIPHHLLDVANPKRMFTVAQFQKLADEKIKEILSRGKVPIICGGTGFYISAVTDGTVFPDVPPNQKLRASLEKKSAPVLFRMITRMDPKRAKKLDPKNKVRLIRAIEIARTLGKVPKVKRGKPPYEFTKIGLYLPTEELKKKIERRLLARMKAGMAKEVSDLQKNGLSWRRLEELGLEYKYVARYLQKKMTKNEMLEKLETEIYRYAKRQMQWWKKDKKIKWVNVSDSPAIKRLGI